MTDIDEGCGCKAIELTKGEKGDKGDRGIQGIQGIQGEPAPDAWSLNGNTEGAEKYFGTNDNFNIPIYTNGTVIGLFDTSGNFGFGKTSSLSSRVHVKGLDSGNTNYSFKVDNSSDYPMLYVRNDGKVSIGTTTTVGIPNNTCDLNISHDTNSVDYISLWNNNNGDGMLFIEENAIGFPVTSKNGTLIQAKIHLFAGGAYTTDLRMDNNAAKIYFAGTEGWIDNAGWLRISGASTVFDLAGYEGQDFRIGTDGNATSGKGLRLIAHGSGSFRDCIKIINGGANIPVVEFPQGKINISQSTNASPADGDLWYDGTHLYFRIGGSTKQLDN